MPKELEGVVRTVTRQGWDKKLLAQASPDPNAYDAIYTAPAQARGIITLIVVCETNAAATTYRLHHADTGAAASQANALRYTKAIGASANEDIPCGSDSSGIAVSPGGKIYFGSVTGDCTCSLYGYEESVI